MINLSIQLEQSETQGLQMQETIIYDTSTRCTSTWERLTILPFHFPVKHSSAYEVGVWNSFLGLLMLLLCQQGWCFFFFFIQILTLFFCFLHLGVLLCCSTLEKISNTIFWTVPGEWSFKLSCFLWEMNFKVFMAWTKWELLLQLNPLSVRIALGRGCLLARL